ncbi:MAG: hypothetical protein D6687_00280 [Acidobacteria bacterium]|jgi:hypothetical protein|nr:MAG: hypothetical protein D6687_00280 [Acidobacteriota bacterium]GIU81031.1 MAG: hypothetical protein KatS3mg006_0095 [Pyrinomonadaceae bacterium]
MAGKLIRLALFLTFLAISAKAQSEVTLHLNEKFFEELLNALFRQDVQLEFSLAKSAEKPDLQEAIEFRKAKFINAEAIETQCNKIRLQRQLNNTKTAVYFRDGKILVPIAFTGSYNPPLIGCIDFSGIAETNINLYFDPQTQTLLGKVTVLSVNLSGTGGIGGSLIARLVQGSIDEKINPINILELEKLSFTFPIRDRNEIKAEIKMKAVGIRHEVINGGLNVFIKYKFE